MCLSFCHCTEQSLFMRFNLPALHQCCTMQIYVKHVLLGSKRGWRQKLYSQYSSVSLHVLTVLALASNENLGTRLWSTTGEFRFRMHQIPQKPSCALTVTLQFSLSHWTSVINLFMCIFKLSLIPWKTLPYDKRVKLRN